MRRTAVLDVGAHSAALTVVRRPPRAARPPRTRDPADPGLWEIVATRKVRLKLHRMLTDDDRLSDRGVASVQRAVARALKAAPARRPPLAFATSVIRDAPNREEIIARVAAATGTRLRVLPALEEARLAYVAARRWSGATDRPLLVLDIGGGTVEIAYGTGHQPLLAMCLPLGARQVTRRWLPEGTAPAHRLRQVREDLRRALAEPPGLPAAAPGTRVLACSKTFAQLARLARTGDGTRLDLPGLRASADLLAATEVSRRGELPGISRHRAEQSLAGALVAEALMDACQAREVEICPWSTREGLLLEHLGLHHP
ncbi:Ppx/GppA phosphatase family protein [Spongiactinospora sp. 9N601]|uniref:Ppx/GppA phosphatase family protein n=1 Tax=Spongiactinospora sp. 9N601 TaxID=3375149 RepID=UPI0037A6EC78